MNTQLVMQISFLLTTHLHKCFFFLALTALLRPAMAGNNLSSKAPYVHFTPIGYALVGKICVYGEIAQEPVVLRTDIRYENPSSKYVFGPKKPPVDVFDVHPDDDLPGMSIDNRIFVSMMQEGACITDQGKL